MSQTERPKGTVWRVTGVARDCLWLVVSSPSKRWQWGLSFDPIEFSEEELGKWIVSSFESMEIKATA